QGAVEAGTRITRLFVSAIEHDSVLANAAALAERAPGLRLEVIPVTSDGVVDLDALRGLLREGKGRALVAVMAANNETGTVQAIAQASRLVREAGALLLVDAVPAAHKIGGPQGVGALLVRDQVPLAPQLVGGGQQKGLRAGTENLSGIAGFGAA